MTIYQSFSLSIEASRHLRNLIGNVQIKDKLNTFNFIKLNFQILEG